jgi:hypothetical protein
MRCTNPKRAVKIENLRHYLFQIAKVEATYGVAAKGKTSAKRALGAVLRQGATVNRSSKKCSGPNLPG